MVSIFSKVCIKSFSFRRFDVLNDYEPATMVIFKLQWKPSLQIFFFLRARLAKDFYTGLKAYQSRFIGAREVEKGLAALAVLLVITTN